MQQIFYDLERFFELSDFEIDTPSIQTLPRVFCRRANLEQATELARRASGQRTNRHFHGLFGQKTEYCRLLLVILGRIDPDRTKPITLGMLKPEDVASADDVVRMLNRPLRVIRLNRFEIDRALQVGFEGSPTGWDTSGTRVVTLPFKKVGPDSPVPDLVDAVIVDAVARKASDIHIESYFQDADLRLRIDGILHNIYTHFSPANLAEVVSRIKIMSGLDIAERQRPQDGRFRFTFVDGAARCPVDFRVSVLPGPSGEDVVIRILDANQSLLSVSQLGMAPNTLDIFRRLLANPEGLIVVTGPTSSGKTTTLYAALSSITDDARKIITAEDPIEYYIDRVNQKQVTQHMSMMDVLRASLRQNPDVLLVGELRDMDSASTAVAAAETGHLVLATVHTSDALGVITRLRGIGLDNADIGATLVASVGQRLVRKICPKCCVETEPTPDQHRAFGPLLEGKTWSAGKGCPACSNTGYKGRIGVYELLVCGAEVQDAIHDGRPAHEILRFARKAGFRTMTEDAIGKAAAGITTLDEVVRVIPYRQIVTLRNEVTAL